MIGISQFPSNLHPNIDSMAAKSYVLGLTQRPFTTYDQHWELVCMLCTELPTLENGKAVAEDAPGGKQGVALTYTIRPDATWGDGTPITTGTCCSPGRSAATRRAASAMPRCTDASGRST